MKHAEFLVIVAHMLRTMKTMSILADLNWSSNFLTEIKLTLRKDVVKWIRTDEVWVESLIRRRLADVWSIVFIITSHQISHRSGCSVEEGEVSILFETSITSIHIAFYSGTLIWERFQISISDRLLEEPPVWNRWIWLFRVHEVLHSALQLYA